MRPEHLSKAVAGARSSHGSGGISGTLGRLMTIMRYKDDQHRMPLRACISRQVLSGLMSSGAAGGPDAAVRGKRRSTAVIAAVVSVAAGTLFLRFLSARAEAQRCEKTDEPGIVAEEHRGAKREPPDPPSLRVLFRRIEDTFATGYQTMTAIIQGVALVVLVTTSGHAVFGGTSSSQVAAAASQAVAVFVIIIFTTDQFFQLTAATRWLPSTIDTAIPYLAGAGEAIAALSLGDSTRWWGAISWSLLAGAIAFGHSAAQAAPEGFEGIEDYYRQFVRDVRRSRNLCAALCVYAIALALTSALAHPPPWLSIAAPWVITAAAVVRVVQVRWGGVPAADA